MSKPDTIKIDDIEYVRKGCATTGAIRIVILQRGWVMVGRFSQSGEHCRLEQAAVIRKWGTTKGLGELAYNGPLKDTVLDPCPSVLFHELTVVASLECVEAKWAKELI